VLLISSMPKDPRLEVLGRTGYRLPFTTPTTKTTEVHLCQAKVVLVQPNVVK
jgi:hypothetical protein